MTAFRIALIGNPNCGKTTLFNALTGSHQKVGNWPGVTVERKSGSFRYADQNFEITDLPGIYSLEQEYLGLDEKIARDYLQQGQFDVVVNVVDASNLQRNLILTQQVLEMGYATVVALNMTDIAVEHGQAVDPVKLADELGAMVVPIVASRQQGVGQLTEALMVAEAASGGSQLAPQDTVSSRIAQRYQRAQTVVNQAVQMVPVTDTFTDRLDRIVLNRYLGIPIFLVMMYLIFTVAINVGAVFIDFFDILFAGLFVELPRWWLESIGAPAWLTVLLADGLGGGIQLVATFIPVIGALFLCLALLEESGYMSRAAFVVDRLMAGIGLPGNAFVPLIVGFGCNVPAVMAARSLGRESDRLLTIAMAPFMSCGARLTVYALFAAALFPVNGQNVVFGLYLLGIAMAILTGWVFRKQIFADEMTPSFQEMPTYHRPVLRNILLTSWFRLKGFIFRAGKTIVLVVVALSFLNSVGTDGSFGNEDSEESVLASIGKAITPVFAPIGLKEDNWPATVGLFTGIFAKEAVVGTLDALYSDVDETEDDSVMPDLVFVTGEAFVSIRDNAIGLLDGLGDPLGIRVEVSESAAAAADAQGVAPQTLTKMAALFGSQFSAFCYLVFVLLYAPCVAVLGAIVKEAGYGWMFLTFGWTTGLGYLTASCLYQLGNLMHDPLFSAGWLMGSTVVGVIAVKLLSLVGQKKTNDQLIQVTPL